MSKSKSHNYNPKGDFARGVAKNFQKASTDIWNQFKSESIGKPDLIIHGIELEGFISKQNGHLATQSAKPILEKLDQRFTAESGGHHIEFTSSPMSLGISNYDSLLEDIQEQRRIVDRACLQSEFNFVTRSIPLDLPSDPENDLDLFTTDPFLVEHRAYDQEIMGLLDEPFRVQYRNGKTAFSMRDFTLGLPLICGIHNNVSFTKPETALRAFNLFLQLAPLTCALGANGGTLGGKHLLKRDTRLHIGLMSECVRVKIDHDPYLDAGLPLPLTNGWEEYIQRLTNIGFMLSEKDLNAVKDDFYALYDNLIEQSWAFAKLKIFDGRLGVEFRPLSAQSNSEANAAYHMFIVWTLTNLLENEEFKNNSWENLGRDIQAALKAGPNSIISFNGKRTTAIKHFEEIAISIKPKIIMQGLADKPLFDHVINTVRKTMKFNSLELSNYDRYRSKIISDFTFSND